MYREDREVGGRPGTTEGINESKAPGNMPGAREPAGIEKNAQCWSAEIGFKKGYYTSSNLQFGYETSIKIDFNNTIKIGSVESFI